MYRVQLYGKQKLLQEVTTKTHRAALVAVDAMITAIHQGRHGSGDFRVAAERVNELGLCLEEIFDSDTFPYPRKTRAA